MIKNIQYMFEQMPHSQADDSSPKPTPVTRRDFLKGAGILAASVFAPEISFAEEHPVKTKENAYEISEDDMERLRQDPQAFAYESYDNYKRYVQYQNTRFNEYHESLFSDFNLGERSQEAWNHYMVKIAEYNQLLREYYQGNDKFPDNGKIQRKKDEISLQYLAFIETASSEVGTYQDKEQIKELAQFTADLAGRVTHYNILTDAQKKQEFENSQHEYYQSKPLILKQRQWLENHLARDEYRHRMREAGYNDGNIYQQRKEIKNARVYLDDYFYEPLTLRPDRVLEGVTFSNKKHIPEDIGGSSIVNYEALVRSKALVIHELGHVIERTDSETFQSLRNTGDRDISSDDVTNAGLAGETYQSYQTEYARKYFLSPSEFYARRLELIYQLEQYGVYTYGEEFTEEHKGWIDKYKGLLDESTREFLLHFKDNLVEIVNALAHIGPDHIPNTLSNQEPSSQTT